MSIVLRLAASEAWRRPGHTAILVAAVSLGVALVTAVQAVNRSTLSSLKEAIASVAGEAQLQVRAQGDNVPEDSVDLVRAQAGVAHASPLVSGTLWVTAGPAEGETLTLFGVDLTDDRSVRTYRVAQQDRSTVIDDPLEFLAQPDSVVLSDELIRRFGMRRGDQLQVLGPNGAKALTVRGSLAPEGMGRLFGGELAIMDLDAAQRLLGRDRVVDQIDVVVTPGKDVERVKTALQGALPPGLEVIAPQQRGEATERIVAAFQMLLAGISALGLFFGTFVSYNVAATAIAARLNELSTLRCVGASRRQMRAFALASVAVPATVASILGVGLGAALAPGLVAPLAHTISFGARVALHVQDATVPIAAVPVALLAGIAAAMLGAWGPAQQAARMVPWEIGRAEESSRIRTLIWLGLAALVLAGVGVAAGVASESAPIAGVAILLINIALVLLSLAALPMVHAPLGRALGSPAATGGSPPKRSTALPCASG